MKFFAHYSGYWNGTDAYAIINADSMDSAESIADEWACQEDEQWIKAEADCDISEDQQDGGCYVYEYSPELHDDYNAQEIN